MPNDKKKYVVTSIVLATIGAVSGGLIALANLATAAKIEQNTIDKTNRGLAEIFVDSTFNEIKDDRVADPIITYYEALKGTERQGYVFYTSGSNMYGNISMLVGLVYNSSTSEYESKSISLINNTQTYATEVVQNYVVPLNNGENPDVKCGATYAAKLIKGMIDESVNFANTNLKEGN